MHDDTHDDTHGTTQHEDLHTIGGRGEATTSGAGAGAGGAGATFFNEMVTSGSGLEEVFVLDSKSENRDRAGEAVVGTRACIRACIR